MLPRFVTEPLAVAGGFFAAGNIEPSRRQPGSFSIFHSIFFTCHLWDARSVHTQKSSDKRVMIILNGKRKMLSAYDSVVNLQAFSVDERLGTRNAGLTIRRCEMLEAQQIPQKLSAIF